jgi:long-chain acyl-CoA synthetase
LSSINIAEVFVALGRRWPDQPAIVSRNLTLSYSELAARASRAARELRTQGVGPGVNIGIVTSDNAEATVLIIALWMLGAAAVPLDFRLRPAERAVLAKEFDLVTILEERKAPGELGYQSIIVDKEWTDVIAKHDSLPILENREPTTALISLTSGTTSRPAGIVFDHERYLLRLLYRPDAGHGGPGGRLLIMLPLAGSGPRNQTFSHLISGETVYFHPPLFSAEELTEVLIANKITSTFVVPTIVRDLLAIHGTRSAPAFPDLELLYCGGAPMAPDEKQLAKKTLSKYFLETYISSISGRITTLTGEDVDKRPDSVGRVVPYVILQIVDGEDRPMKTGEHGSIRVRSPAMALGIYGGSTRAAGDRIKDGWVYPGEIGSLDADGYLTIHGRESDVIIRNGINIHPAEIEVAIAEFPGVTEVAVTGFSSPREGDSIAAFIVGGGVSEADLAAHCLLRLSADKRPGKLVFVSELPRNANGKVVRKQLREQLEKTA